MEVSQHSVLIQFGVWDTYETLVLCIRGWESGHTGQCSDEANGRSLVMHDGTGWMYVSMYEHNIT